MTVCCHASSKVPFPARAQRATSPTGRPHGPHTPIGLPGRSSCKQIPAKMPGLFEIQDS